MFEFLILGIHEIRKLLLGRNRRLHVVKSSLSVVNVFYVFGFIVVTSLHLSQLLIQLSFYFLLFFILLRLSVRIIGLIHLHHFLPIYALDFFFKLPLFLHQHPLVIVCFIPSHFPILLISYLFLLSLKLLVQLSLPLCLSFLVSSAYSLSLDFPLSFQIFNHFLFGQIFFILFFFLFLLIHLFLLHMERLDSTLRGKVFLLSHGFYSFEAHLLLLLFLVGFLVILAKKDFTVHV